MELPGGDAHPPQLAQFLSPYFHEATKLRSRCFSIKAMGIEAMGRGGGCGARRSRQPTRTRKDDEQNLNRKRSQRRTACGFGAAGGRRRPAAAARDQGAAAGPDPDGAGLQLDRLLYRRPCRRGVCRRQQPGRQRRPLPRRRPARRRLPVQFELGAGHRGTVWLADQRQWRRRFPGRRDRVAGAARHRLGHRSVRLRLGADARLRQGRLRVCGQPHQRDGGWRTAGVYG